MSARTYAAIVTGIFVPVLAFAPGAGAATLTVNDTADDIGAGGTCTLREALEAANVNADIGRGCVNAGGFGNDTIVLTDPAGYALSRPAQPATPDDNLEGDLDVNPINAGESVSITATVPTSINGAGIDRVLDVRPGAVANVSGVTIRGGQADFGGGVRVLAAGATLNMTGVTVTDNRAVSSTGGGISSQGATTLTNSTISGNVSLNSGGGIAVSAGTTTLNSVTVSDNTADVNGDELGDGGGAEAFGGILNLRNTILAGNQDNSDPGSQAADCVDNGGSIGSLGNNLIGTTAGCGYAAGAGDRTDQAPLLGALADNGGFAPTHALLAGSPAIDGGAACPATDQRGTARPQGPGCDIGAFERVPESAPAAVPTGKPKRKCKRKRKAGRPASSAAKRKRCKKRRKKRGRD